MVVVEVEEVVELFAAFNVGPSCSTEQVLREPKCHPAKNIDLELRLGKRDLKLQVRILGGQPLIKASKERDLTTSQLAAIYTISRDKSVSATLSVPTLTSSLSTRTLSHSSRLVVPINLNSS